MITGVKPQVSGNESIEDGFRILARMIAVSHKRRLGALPPDLSAFLDTKGDSEVLERDASSRDLTSVRMTKEGLTVRVASAEITPDEVTNVAK